MYIGETDETGLHHLVFEVVDNSVDEALAKHASKIVIVIHLDGSVTIRTMVEVFQSSGKTTKTKVLGSRYDRPARGGKFSNETYKHSAGLHGVGVSCVNGLSEWFE